MTKKQRAGYKTWDRAMLITEINRLMRVNETIRTDERAKVIEDVHKAMAYKYHCKEDLCEVGMTCADCLKAYMEDLYSNKQ